MVYLTSCPNATFKVAAKSTFFDPPEFIAATFSFLYNGHDEMISALFRAKSNNVLYLEDIQKTDIARRYYPNEHLGTELFVTALLEMTTKWKIDPKRIDGRLANSDAKSHAWDVSIPFYYKLPLYISKHLQRSYTFHIFYDKECTQELQFEGFGSDIKTEAKNIRQRYEKTDKDLYFSFLSSSLD